MTLATGAITVTTADAAVNFSGTVNGAQALTVNAGQRRHHLLGQPWAARTPLTSLTDAGGTTAINGGGIRTQRRRRTTTR